MNINQYIPLLGSVGVLAAVLLCVTVLVLSLETITVVIIVVVVVAVVVTAVLVVLVAAGIIMDVAVVSFNGVIVVGSKQETLLPNDKNGINDPIVL